MFEVCLHPATIEAFDTFVITPRVSLCQPAESPRERRKRRRQLLFIDENTQISQEEMRARIEDAQTETRPLVRLEPFVFFESALFCVYK